MQDDTHPAEIAVHSVSHKIAIEIAAELREHPDRWFQGDLVRLADGTTKKDVVSAVRRDAVCWCLEGHILRRSGVFHQPVMETFRRTLGRTELYIWNDEPGRTVADVIALCDTIAAAFARPGV